MQAGGGGCNSFPTHPFSTLAHSTPLPPPLLPLRSWFDLDLSSQPYRSLRYHAHAVRGAAFHRSYPLFASASDDAAVHVFHGRVYSDLMTTPLIVPGACMGAATWVPAVPVGWGAGWGVLEGASCGVELPLVSPAPSLVLQSRFVLSRHYLPALSACLPACLPALPCSQDPAGPRDGRLPGRARHRLPPDAALGLHRRRRCHDLPLCQPMMIMIMMVCGVLCGTCGERAADCVMNRKARRSAVRAGGPSFSLPPRR